MTINEIYAEWLKIKRYQVKESSLASYVIAWRTNLQEYFGEREYAEIRMSDIQSFVNKMISDGLSVKTVKDRAMIIKMILLWAQEEYSLPPIPGRRKLIYPTSAKSGQNDLCTLVPAEQKAIVNYCKENISPSNVAIMLTLSTGLRIGEVCGIKFSDFDLKEGTLTINRTVMRVYSADPGEKKTRIIIGTPKTLSSHRTIPVPAALLREIKKWAAIYKPDYFLASAAEKPLEPRRLRNIFNGICESVGVKHIKFHGLRHTFATTLLENKVDIKTTSELLGHSDVSITMDVYMHPSDEHKRRAVKVLDNLFK